MLIGRFLVLKEQNSPTFWLKALLIMSSRDAESGTTARNSYIAMAAAFHGGRLGWNNATCVGFWQRRQVAHHSLHQLFSSKLNILTIFGSESKIALSRFWKLYQYEKRYFLRVSRIFPGVKWAEPPAERADSSASDAGVAKPAPGLSSLSNHPPHQLILQRPRNMLPTRPHFQTYRYISHQL